MRDSSALTYKRRLQGEECLDVKEYDHEWGKSGNFSNFKEDSAALGEWNGFHVIGGIFASTKKMLNSVA